MFKKIFFTLIIVAIVIFGGLSVYVSTIDWNQHKAKIAAQVEKITDKKVVFEGPVSLSFIPHPYLTAENVKIYNQGEEDGQPLAVIKEVVTDLSLSALVNGNFEIDNMTLQDAQITLEFLGNGRLNWYSEVSDFQDDTFNNVEVALNSVMLKNATVEIVNSGLDVDAVFTNLNAEITAQSLHGPYRIDGNFVKDGHPAGFALNLGTLSESFGTSVNLVLTHPTTDSYARFDGQILSNNAEIEGNFMVESKNLAKFTNEFASQVIIPSEFNYPFSGSVELKVNPQEVNLSGLVLKYGDDTAGAGNILFPLQPANDEEKRTAKIVLEMTGLDLNPIVGVLYQQLKKYDHKPFLFDLDFDLVADLRAVKAFYNNDDIRDFDFSADITDNILTIKKLSALLPGDTEASISGDIFENKKQLSYDLQIDAAAKDSFRFLKWLGYEPKTFAPSTYKDANLTTRLSGNLNQIKISPLSVTLDNNSVTGIIGIVRDKRTQLFISAQSDNLNLDNYFPKLIDTEAKLSFIDKIKSGLNQLTFLNEYDILLETKLNSGIYQKIPFNNLAIKLQSDDGNVQIHKFHVNNIASADIDFTGKLNGLGQNPAMENLKYSLSSDNFQTFKNKFNIPLPQWPLFTKAQKIKATGIMTGNFDTVNLKAVTDINGNFFKSVYTGKVFNQNNTTNFRGKLEFNTEFKKFINAVGFNYKPRNLPASIFTFKGIVTGNADNWAAQDINAFISANNFSGDFSVVRKNSRPTVKANITTNRLEFDRLIYNPEKPTQQRTPALAEKVAFLPKPVFDETNIDYSFYKTFDLTGKISAQILNYKSEEFSDVSAEITINNGEISVRQFQARYGRDTAGKSSIQANFTLDVKKDPRIKGSALFTNIMLNNIGGEKYKIQKGRLKARIYYDAPATSELAFIENLNGKMSLDIDKPVIDGFDLKRLTSDLRDRTTSENLAENASKYLQSGTTSFYLIGSEVDFRNGDYIFKDAIFSNKYETIDAAGMGNLKNWTTDITFTMHFEELKDKVLPIEFSWKGSLSNPHLSVNVSANKDKYDAYWAKIAQERQEAENARLAALKESMDKTQEKVRFLSRQVENGLLPMISKYKSQSSNAEIKSVYDSNELQLNDINANLDFMKNRASEEYTDKDIQDMNALLEVYETQINGILQQITENVHKDSKFHAGKTFKDIINAYDNAQEKASNSQKNLNTYVARLIQLNSLIILDREPKILDYKNSIKTSVQNIDGYRIQANQIKEQILETEDLDEIDVKHALLQELKQKSEAELQTLNNNLNDMYKYAQDIIVQEEEKYKESLVPTVEETSAAEENASPEDNKNSTENNKDNNTTADEETSSAPQNKIVEQATVADTVVKENTPLMRPLDTSDGIITYTSRDNVTGTLNSTQQKANSQSSENKNSTGLLLQPVSGDKIEASGSLTRKR